MNASKNFENSEKSASKVIIIPTDPFIHLVAGGCGGTVGAILTCPLEVVKTRLQSSKSGFRNTDYDVVKPMNQNFTESVINEVETQTSQNSYRSSALDINARVATREKLKLSNFITSSRGKKFYPDSNTSFRFSVNEAKDTNRLRHTGRFYSIQGLVINPAFTNFSFSSSNLSSNPNSKSSQSKRIGIYQCLRFIVMHEGIGGLFKGLGPNLVGVAPSRAIYFGSYNMIKKNLNLSVPPANQDTPMVHMVSAAAAGFCASSFTNPIWLLKTRLQLDLEAGSRTLSVSKSIQHIYRNYGVLGFWKGVTASYWGVSETVIHFVIYEYLKKRVNDDADSKRTAYDFLGYMACGACSKTIATIIAYPHEVARTRLREDGTKYRSFWQTLSTVYREEGKTGIYRGLGTQLVRQIPNTAIMMCVYELTVYLLTRYKYRSVEQI